MLILKSVLIFKDIKCLMKKNNYLLFERQKHSANWYTAIITAVMAVTNSSIVTVTVNCTA
jgi:hypothetical protein